ncbi:MAG TPA: alginate lyase family protein, partial [Pyrinomonadaceae bacterium]
CLPELRRAARWREAGRGILLEQLTRQVRPDGVYFEQASYYQRYTADFYTHFMLLARAAGEASRVFPDGGYYVMRDGWTNDSNYMLLDCGPHGAMNGGHAHADALSFTLAARGRTLLVDPGTCTYTGSGEWRDHFRHTSAHNALVVDGKSSSVTAGTFSWETSARCEAGEWLSRPRFDFFEGAHDGYRRLPDPVTHRRSVLFVKGDYFVIRDEADARARHRYGLRFHLAPGAPPQVGSGHSAVRLLDPSAPGVELHARGGGGRWIEGLDWVAPCYGSRVAAPVWTFEAEGEGPQDFVTVVLPRAAGAQEGARVTSTKGVGAAHSLEVVAEGARDVLVIGRAGRTVSAGQLTTDFAWAWARLGPDGRVAEAVLVGGGTRFRFGGRELLASPRPLRYAVARTVAGRLEFESEPEGSGGSGAAAGGDSVIVDGALKRRDKLSKEGRGADAPTLETTHPRHGL